MARRNRLDPEDLTHIEVRANPTAFTRASRRAVGLRGPVHADRMRAFYSQNTVLPRAVRRLMRDTLKAERRVSRKQAKVGRLLAKYGGI